MSFEPISFHDLAAPGIGGLQPYQPGKPESELAREYGVTDIVKLASNENPLGPSPRARDAMSATIAGVHRYPDGNAHELRWALAEYHAVDPAAITFGNGSNDVLDLVARAFLAPGRSAVFSEHAFAVYPIATLSAGAEAIVTRALPADHPDQPYGHDLEAMAAAISGHTRVVFVANPNNPTGTWLRGDQVERFLDRVPAEVVVVLDEAYVEYAQDADGYVDGADWLSRYPNLVLTRTFSKAYGLAGLRVGYALSSLEIADLMNRVRHPFNLNAVAQAAALAALHDQEHVTEAVAMNRRERTRLKSALADRGLRCLPSAANFLCVEVGDRAGAVNEALLRAGIIVRPVAGYRLPRFLRVSIGTEAENDRLLDALGRPEIAALLERTA
jgi:histidinol-phosphate aminotransferase